MNAGAVCWIDLGTVDVERSVTFYGALLGWTVGTPEAEGYRLARRNDRLIAGLGPADDQGAPYWTVYIHTPDITSATAAAVAAGATVVVPPTKAGDAGIGAVIRDPAGGPLSLWQPLAHAGSSQTGEHGTFAGAALHESRADQHAEFVTAVFGTDTVELVAGVGAEQYPSPWIVSFHVDDVEAAARHATELGADAAPGLPDAFIDPNGALFRLRQHRQSHGEGGDVALLRE